MADIYTAADERTKQLQRALMQAIAESGSLGKQAFADTLQQAVANQVRATQEAMARSGALGGVSAAPYTEMVSRPQAALGADTSAADRLFSQSLGVIGAANQAYLGQAGAAVPVLRARSAAKIAAMREQARRNAEMQSLQAQLARERMDLEREKIGLAREQLRSGGGLTPKERQMQEALKEQQRQTAIVNALNRGASKETQRAFWSVITSPLAQGQGYAGAQRLLSNATYDPKTKTLTIIDPSIQNAEPMVFKGVPPEILADWVYRFYGYAPPSKPKPTSSTTSSAPATPKKTNWTSRLGSIVPSWGILKRFP